MGPTASRVLICVRFDDLDNRNSFQNFLEHGLPGTTRKRRPGAEGEVSCRPRTCRGTHRRCAALVGVAPGSRRSQRRIHRRARGTRGRRQQLESNGAAPKCSAGRPGERMCLDWPSRANWSSGPEDARSRRVVFGFAGSGTVDRGAFAGRQTATAAACARQDTGPVVGRNRPCGGARDRTSAEVATFPTRCVRMRRPAP